MVDDLERRAMRVISMRLSILTPATIVAGLLVAGSSFADPPLPPDPPNYNDANHAGSGPPDGHTAQDNLDDPPTDHTAQDNGDPAGKNPDSPGSRDSPLRDEILPRPHEPLFTAPLVDLLKLTLPDAPDPRDYRDGYSDQPVLSVGGTGGVAGATRGMMPVSGTLSTVPSPGALVLLGLGALTLNRRRRRG